MTNGEFTITFPPSHFEREFELPYKGYLLAVKCTCRTEGAGHFTSQTSRAFDRISMTQRRKASATLPSRVRWFYPK
jgi:hypothetical protein